MTTATVSPNIVPAHKAGWVTRAAVMAYATFSYTVFLGVFLYAIGFIVGFGVPTSLDAAPRMALVPALVINLGVLSLFALQHSGMARPAFKRVLTRFIPGPAERATYCLASSAAMIALFALWQPMGGVIWDAAHPAARIALYAAGAAGWCLVLLSTFLINHFDLFGLRQAWLCFRGREYMPLRFREPFAYRIVRHPLYVGWLMAFWFTPTMTAAHLLFAAVCTAYILVAIRLEERDLIAEHGERYLEYRRRVPMLVPFANTLRAA